MTKSRLVLGAQLLGLALAFFATPIVRFFLEADQIDATASSSYSDEFEAQMVLDGDPNTEWCLPDGTLGYIDLAFKHGRHVHAVRLTNGHNRQYKDRAITKAQIVVYYDDNVVERHDVELPGIESDHKERRVELKGRWATRVRLEVLAYAGNGGALAELHVE
jgi:hypothetical protein